MSKKMVRVLYPGLTYGTKVYGRGEVEENPSQYLIDLAEKKVRQYHRDLGKEILVATIVDQEDIEQDNEQVDIGDEYDYRKKVKRTPITSVNDVYDDDIKDVKDKRELINVVKKLGLTQGVARTLDVDKLKKTIMFLRKL